MAATDKTPPIVVKRIKKRAGGHHGGTWKIAYADFVTAMMAFFLLMWLLGSTAKGDLTGIAEYFKTPLKVALQGGVGSGDATAVIKGGGTDITRANGQVRRGNAAPEKKTAHLAAAKAELARRELEKLKELKARVEAAITTNPMLSAYRNQIKLDITAEGLRIQIVDEQNRPMFDSGRAEVKAYMRDILREIGTLLNGVENNVSLAGHTDAAPYALGERAYSNWELSADRANASRRELITWGMDERKVLRVVGLGSSIPLDNADPFNPINRRISIVVLNRKTEQAIRNEDSAATEVRDAAEAEAAISGAQPAAVPPADPPAAPAKIDRNPKMENH